MAVNRLSVSDRDRFAAARAQGRARRRDPSAIVDAKYVTRLGSIALTFRGGGSMLIPRQLIPELSRASLSHLRTVSVSPAGDALSWSALDVDVYVPGLVARAFGTRLFAAAAGGPGGRRRPLPKAVAIEADGAKRGRPRKRLTA